MYKIQSAKVGVYEWFDMVNMPNFFAIEQAETWLEEKNVQLFSDVLAFRIVNEETGQIVENYNQ